jgi:hypothetical protein
MPSTSGKVLRQKDYPEFHPDGLFLCPRRRAGYCYLPVLEAPLTFLCPRRRAGYCDRVRRREPRLHQDVSMPSTSGGVLRPSRESLSCNPFLPCFYALDVGRGIATAQAKSASELQGCFYALDVGRGIATPLATGPRLRSSFYALDVGRVLRPATGFRRLCRPLQECRFYALDVGRGIATWCSQSD